MPTLNHMQSLSVFDSETGKKDETFDMVEVRVLDEYSGSTINLCNKQKGEL